MEKNKNRKLNIYFILMLLVISPRVSAEEFPKFQTGDLVGLEVENEKKYDGSSLWGYMNGGADLYLEYGFNKLLVQQVKWRDQQFKVEIFQMIHPAAAFGIFSIFQYNCSETIADFPFSCSTAYQSKIAKSRFYFSVINEKGSPESQKLSNQIATFLAKKTQPIIYELPAVYQDTLFAPFRYKLKLMVGGLGIQNGVPEWTANFERFDDYRLFVLKIQDTTGISRGKMKLAMVDFSTANDCNQYLTDIGFTTTKENHQEINKENQQFSYWKWSKKAVLLIVYHQQTPFIKTVYELIKQHTR